MSVLTCSYCGYQGKTLVRHLTTAMPPHPDISAYRLMYPGEKMVSETIEILRSDTLTRRGIKRGRKRGTVYLGVSEKIAATKMRQHGQAGYNNPDKRRRTMLERYGVENPMKLQNIKDKALRSRELLKDDDNSSIITKDALEKRFLMGKGVAQVSEELSTAPWVIRKLVKDYGLVAPIVRKSPVKCTPVESVRRYLKKCQNMNKVLSFTEYGAIEGFRFYNRMIRLFGSHARYGYLLEDLKAIALNPDSWDGFLLRLQ